jgi:hypothetical protein
LNFLKEKIQKYHEKKLRDAKEKLRLHTEIKNHLERRLKTIESEQSNDVKKKIEKQTEFIEIWKNNIDSINKQIKKLKS